MEPLDPIRAQRIYALVTNRRNAYQELGTHAGAAGAAGYLRLCLRLPATLHQNGLTHTLNYLRFLASPQGRNHKQAQHLLDDWLDSGTDTDRGWHLQGLAGGDNNVTEVLALVEFRLASRLARREADWFKRCAQALLGTLPAAAPQQEPANVAR